MSMSDRYDGYVPPDILLNNKRAMSAYEEYDFDIEHIKNILLKTYELSLNKIYTKHLQPGSARGRKEDPPERKRLKGSIENIIFRFKSYTLLNPATIEFIRDSVSNEVELIDFFFSLRSSFFLYLDIKTYQKESFYNKLVDFIYIPNHETSIIDNNIMKRISPYNRDPLITLLKDNDFLVPIVLINNALSVFDIESL